MSHTKLTIASYICYLSLVLLGDFINAEVRAGTTITPTRVANDVAIRLDGRVSELEWQRGALISDFRLINHAPDEIVKGTHETTVRLLYNDNGLYVAFELKQPISSLVKIHSAQDRGSSERDFVTVALDTSGVGQYGSYFTLYLGGSKGDGVLSPERTWIGNWDGAWFGRTAEDSEGWSAELFIPWSILSMPKSNSEREIGLFLARKFAHESKYYGFPAIHVDAPRFLSDFVPMTLKQVNVKRQLSIFPFISSQVDTVAKSSREQYGVDLFWRPVPHIQVTGTLQPDFGTVEADDVIINLSAFESFFPDRRLFFVEGREIFLPTNQAYGSLVPFHSRRIGAGPVKPYVADDTQIDLSRLAYGTELYGAIKAIGRFERFRYGILGAWEKDTTFRAESDNETFSLTSPGREFGVLRLLYANNATARYRVGMLSALSRDESQGDAYTHSIDFRFQSKSGRISTESQFLMTDVAHQNSGYAGFMDLRFRQSDQLRHSLMVKRIGPDFDLSRTGYASRSDRTTMRYRISKVRYQTARFQEVNHIVSVSGSWNSTGQRTETSVSLGVSMRDLRQNNWSVYVSYTPSYVDDSTAYRSLTFYTNPSVGISLSLASNSTKKFYQIAWLGIQESRIQGNSNSSGVQFVYQPTENLIFNWRLSKDSTDGRILYQGNREFIRYRSWSPTSNVAVQIFLSRRHRIRFDFQWQMIQSKAFEYYFFTEKTQKLSSIGFELNRDSDDFLISRATSQLRYRWEIAPMSDLFIVYSRTGTLNSIVQNTVMKTLRETINQRDTENVAIKFRWRTPLDY